jgi:hypothetical protein
MSLELEDRYERDKEAAIEGISICYHCFNKVPQVGLNNKNKLPHSSISQKSKL